MRCITIRRTSQLSNRDRTFFDSLTWASFNVERSNELRASVKHSNKIKYLILFECLTDALNSLLLSTLNDAHVSESKKVRSRLLN